jgi:hypothetical protein
LQMCLSIFFPLNFNNMLILHNLYPLFLAIKIVVWELSFWFLATNQIGWAKHILFFWATISILLPMWTYPYILGNNVVVDISLHKLSHTIHFLHGSPLTCHLTVLPYKFQFILNIHHMQNIIHMK